MKCWQVYAPPSLRSWVRALYRTSDRRWKEFVNTAESRWVFSGFSGFLPQGKLTDKKTYRTILPGFIDSIRLHVIICINYYLLIKCEVCTGNEVFAQTERRRSKVCIKIPKTEQTRLLSCLLYGPSLFSWIFLRCFRLFVVGVCHLRCLSCSSRLHRFHFHLLCFYVKSFTENQQQCFSSFNYSKYFNEDTQFFFYFCS